MSSEKSCDYLLIGVFVWSTIFTWWKNNRLSDCGKLWKGGNRSFSGSSLGVFHRRLTPHRSQDGSQTEQHFIMITICFSSQDFIIIASGEVNALNFKHQQPSSIVMEPKWGTTEMLLCAWCFGQLPQIWGIAVDIGNERSDPSMIIILASFTVGSQFVVSLQFF